MPKCAQVRRSILWSWMEYQGRPFRITSLRSTSLDNGYSGVQGGPRKLFSGKNIFLPWLKGESESCHHLYEPSAQSLHPASIGRPSDCIPVSGRQPGLKNLAWLQPSPLIAVVVVGWKEQLSFVLARRSSQKAYENQQERKISWNNLVNLNWFLKSVVCPP